MNINSSPSEISIERFIQHAQQNAQMARTEARAKEAEANAWDHAANSMQTIYQTEVARQAATKAKDTKA